MTNAAIKTSYLRKIQQKQYFEIEYAYIESTMLNEDVYNSFKLRIPKECCLYFVFFLFY